MKCKSARVNCHFNCGKNITFCRIYESLLYQIVHNLHLAHDKEKMNEAISYLKEIFHCPDDQHTVTLKKVQLAPKPSRKSSITVIKAIDLDVDAPAGNIGNRFFVTVEFDTARNVVAGTTIKEDFCWNEAVHL